MLVCTMIGAGKPEPAIPAENQNAWGQPLLYQQIDIPKSLLSADETYGGDIRIGDLAGNGQVDFLVYRSVDDAHDGGGLKPCFIGAFSAEGKVLWKVGEGGTQPSRPGPVAIFDIDHDGETEVICFFVDPTKKSAPDSTGNVLIQIRNGQSGAIEKQAAPPALTTLKKVDGANWVHQRILIANFSGRDKPGDLLVKIGSRLLAFDNNLAVLWSYNIPWNTYGKAAAYTPAVGDLDGDGKDEVNGGLYLLGSDGNPKWERFLARNMDCALMAEWDQGKMRAICSGGGFVMDHQGDTILHVGEGAIPHGQELRVGDFMDSIPGPEMIIRYAGHKRSVMTVSNSGEILHKFLLNASPNNTGMETVHWNGRSGADLLYNGGQLWRGNGTLFAQFPDLPALVGPPRMGWYHCIPANVTGDEREEVILYNPWDRFIQIYTPYPHHTDVYEGYQAGPRQYNVRLMD